MTHPIWPVSLGGTADAGRGYLLPMPIRTLPEISTQALVGILVAISGNVLISFALNLQKLAHKRTQYKRHLAVAGAPRQNSHIHDTVPEEPHEEEQQALQDDQDQHTGVTEHQPLIVLPSVHYGAATPPLSRSAPASPVRSRRGPGLRLVPSKFRPKRNAVTETTPLAVEIVTEDAALHGLPNHNAKRPPDNTDVEGNEGDYLKSKIWWLGFFLMNVGEIGNFISYAFAPASVVAPLGTFALIANCFFAPLMLSEQFRTRDLLGVVIAIIGAVTVVLASNASDTRLDAEALLHAILQIPFMVFSIVYIVGVVVLATLSESRFGRRFAVIDVGLCALFGGFTVLSTKALSTLLTLDGLEIFTEWITYPLLFILFATGVGQVRYLNRALMRFDSKMVIPIQFVFFTLSAIIGSAILYGDFKKARFHQIVTFLYGCAATFAGVFVIAWAPHNTRYDELEPDEEEPAPAPESPEQSRLDSGTIGRRRHATLVLPSGVNGIKETTSMGRKRGAISMGISPAQHLLLVHAPPMALGAPLSLSGDDDLGDTDTELAIPSPELHRRRRTMSWYGNDAGAGSRARDRSMTGRRQNGYPRVGSLESYPTNR